MNRNIISIFLLAAMAVLAVGCTRENVAPEPQPSPTVRNVSYVKCGEPGRATVTGDAAWHALLDTLFDAVDDGCEVSFFDATRGEQMTKETVSYRTASRDSAYAWGERMYDSGYVVSVIFDPEDHIYVCSAIKTAPMPQDYTPIPLEQYLPGRWVIDSTVICVFWDGHYDSTQHWIFYDGVCYYDSVGCMTWNYHADDYEIYDSVNDRILHCQFPFHEELVITSDSITRCYPLLPGRSLLDHYELGLNDSTITLSYEIDGRYVRSDSTIYLPTTAFAYNYLGLDSISYRIEYQVYQLNYDTMIIYGYVPAFFFTDLFLINKAFAFVRQ